MKPPTPGAPQFTAASDAGYGFKNGSPSASCQIPSDPSRRAVNSQPPLKMPPPTPSLNPADKPQLKQNIRSEKMDWGEVFNLSG